MTEPVRTTCPYCGVGCGVLVEAGGDGVRVSGDPRHPANAGRLCSKGSALGETLGPEGRLLHPMVRGRQVAWFRALDEVAGGLRRIIDTHGPEAVAFYVSGQLLTEDYYVANKLMKGYLGSANIDTNSRLCMASAVAGHQRAFGEDVVPASYDDLEQAELVVLVGSNTAWCHPVVFQRIMEARRARPEMRVVVVDPRRTATAAEADLHLPLAPGSDVALFNGLLCHLERDGRLDYEFLENHCSGFAAALAAARRGPASTPAVAGACALDEPLVAEFFRLFARSERTVTLFSQGVNQSSQGTDKVNAIINCHLATGRIGRPGAGPLSITGQPNAMGGREVGGLASTLAAHRGFDQADDIQAFWDSPTIARQPGLKAVELFDAVAQGRIRALWIMATNPVVSLPDADRVREALRHCELVVVSDVVRSTDTTPWADVLLPAAGWGEKDGTVTNSERVISRQRAFREPPGEARPDWWMVCEVARRMGFSGFDYTGPEAIFAEHAALSGHANGGRWGFDISALARMDRVAYDALGPVRWPLPAGASGPDTRPLFGDGHFATADGRARLVAVDPRPPAHAPDADYPLVLNTGRVRDHWHTMTRTARSPRLCAHTPEPLLCVHPEDAGRHGLVPGALAQLRSRWGECLARVAVSRETRAGNLFLPIHWNDQFAARARVGAVVNPAVCPVSGEPEFKHTPVRVEPWDAAWYGFLLCRIPVSTAGLGYWVRVPGARFHRYELADRAQPEDWSQWARNLLGVQDANADWLEFRDVRAASYRAALLVEDRLEACLFAARQPELPTRQWLAGLFDQESLGEADRVALLTGRPAGVDLDSGPPVCSCFGVGREAICRAVREQGLRTAEAVGEALGAGTNCGSCLPEIRGLLG